jgi:phosphoribosylformylglycinamidine (FGAM) synthase-like amidotransferase family enzyme
MDKSRAGLQNNAVENTEVQGAGEPNFGIRRAAPPRALVLTGYGINCDYETTHACELAGFRADRVHLNDMIGGLRRLFDFKLLVFPGGFSYGDDLGSGVAFSSKIRLNEDGRLFDALMEYVQRGGLVLGVCNGFQILVRLGIIPALGDRYGEQQVTMAPNQQGYFIDRWVNLIVEPGTGSVFTKTVAWCSATVTVTADPARSFPTTRTAP